MADRDKCRILIANDDGIEAPGIRLLEKIARELSSDVWVVAPEMEQSGASHSLTTRRPLRLNEVGERRYAVDGTPPTASSSRSKSCFATGCPTWCCPGSTAAAMSARI